MLSDVEYVQDSVKWRLFSGHKHTEVKDTKSDVFEIFIVFVLGQVLSVTVYSQVFQSWKWYTKLSRHQFSQNRTILTNKYKKCVSTES